jgi:hypothetical protein
VQYQAERHAGRQAGTMHRQQERKLTNSDVMTLELFNFGIWRNGSDADGTQDITIILNSLSLSSNWLNFGVATITLSYGLSSTTNP